MSEISKQALKVDNSTSFPNNTTGYISPTILRAFNVNMIDSLVEQEGYNDDSSSWNVSIGALNTFTSSQQPSFNQLNAFTSSQLSINSGINLFTQSASGRLNNLESTTSSLNAWSSSVNEIIVNGVGIGYSTRLFFNGYVSASIVPNVGGPIASITVLADQTFASSASFNAYTASTNAWTASAKVEIAQLLAFSSSLDATYATDAQLNFSASVLQNNIDVNNAKFNDYTASINSYTQSFSQSVATSFSASNARIDVVSSFTGSYATTGSNTFVGGQVIDGANLNVLGQFAGISLAANLNNSGSQYPSFTSYVDTSLYSNDGVFSGHSVVDSVTGQTLVTVAGNSYTRFGPETVGGLFGGGVNADSSDAAIIIRTGSADMYVEKPTAFRYAVGITGSLGVKNNVEISGSLNVTGSTILSGSLTITGSAYGNVFSASITSNTASIDLNVANFFTLALPNGVITNINVLNPKPGATAIIEITNTGIPSASFSSNVKQQRFNTYLPSSGSGTTDLLSVISLSTSSVYVANSLNFV